MIDRIFDDVSMMDFDKAAYIIQKGYEDAMAQMETIKSRISRRSDPAELARRRAAFRADLPPLLFDHFESEGLTPD